MEVDRALSERIRASFLLAGPLLARFGRAVMPPPGGDVIGRRRLDPHLDAFRALGADFHFNRDIDLSAPHGLRATDVFMDEPSVMGTENALLAAARTPGTTVIGNAACEPHVQDLARMLREDGRGHPGDRLQRPHGLRPPGPPRLRARDQPRSHRDRLVHGARGRDGRGAAHQGRRRGRPAHDPARLRPPRACAACIDDGDVLVHGGQDLVVARDVGEHKIKIQDGPWPAFPADLTSIAVALATQCTGSVLSTSGCSRTA